MSKIQVKVQIESDDMWETLEIEPFLGGLHIKTKVGDKHFTLDKSEFLEFLDCLEAMK